MTTESKKVSEELYRIPVNTSSWTAALTNPDDTCYSFLIKHKPKFR